jgi:hypothetical protein
MHEYGFYLSKNQRILLAERKTSYRRAEKLRFSTWHSQENSPRGLAGFLDELPRTSVRGFQGKKNSGFSRTLWLKPESVNLASNLHLKVEAIHKQPP